MTPEDQADAYMERQAQLAADRADYDEGRAEERMERERADREAHQ